MRGWDENKDNGSYNNLKHEPSLLSHEFYVIQMKATKKPLLLKTTALNISNFTFIEGLDIERKHNLLHRRQSLSTTIDHWFYFEW